MSETSLSDRWRTALRASDLFGQLEDAALERLAFEERHLEAGAPLLHHGEDAEELFVVLEGQIDVALPNGGAVIRHVGTGGVIGEVALVLGGKRTANAFAAGETRVLALSRRGFERALVEYPAMAAPLTRLLAERMRRGNVAGILRGLFGDLTPEETDEIERQVEWIQLPSGRELLRAGESANVAYLVVVGRLRGVVADAGGDEREVEEIGPGQWVGEMALLADLPHAATVYALRDTELMALSREVFERLITAHPRAMRETTRAFAKRTQVRLGGGAPRRARTKTISVLPTTPAVGRRDLTRDLVAALSRFGRVLHLTAERVDELLSKPGIASVALDNPAHLRLTSWLLEQEEHHDFVVYEAGAEWSAWTERCVRYADHVLIVAEGSGSPELSEVEVRLAAHYDGARAPKQSLVLMQSKSVGHFPGTRRWLARRPSLDQHVHFRPDRPEDVGRLARLLTERAVCVVLSGGGSRGYAHIGFLRALTELGIPVDAIGGTSMGGVVAACQASEWSWVEMLAKVPPGLVRGFATVTLPLVSLLSPRPVEEVIYELVQDQDLEDLPTSMFCVSTNLTRGGEYIHRRGQLSLALRATTSIPGLFPPVPCDGDLLVDGGISNNIPVDTMASLHQGMILAVDVLPDIGLNVRTGASSPPTRWGSARKMLTPKAQEGMPDIVNILLRSATSASKSIERAEASARTAALYLRPTISRWNLADMKNAKVVVDEGYAGTIEALRDWWTDARPHVTGAPRT